MNRAEAARAAGQTVGRAPLNYFNYFFGVRAVDTEGNRSPVTYPRPLGR